MVGGHERLQEPTKGKERTDEDGVVNGLRRWILHPWRRLHDRHDDAKHPRVQRIPAAVECVPPVTLSIHVADVEIRDRVNRRWLVAKDPGLHRSAGQSDDPIPELDETGLTGLVQHLVFEGQDPLQYLWPTRVPSVDNPIS